MYVRDVSAVFYDVFCMLFIEMGGLSTLPILLNDTGKVKASLKQ